MSTLTEIEKKNKLRKGSNIDFEYAEHRYSIYKNPKGDIITSPRRFGIEFECTYKESFKNKLRSDGQKMNITLSDKTNKLGDMKLGRLVPYSFGGDNLSYWDNHIEVRTPPIRLKNGELDVKYFCEKVGTYAYLSGWEGTHVHVESVDIKKDHKKALDLLRFMALYETVVFACLPVSRRRSGWCGTMKNNYVKNEGTVSEFYSEVLNKDISYDEFVEHFTGTRTEFGFSYNTGGEMCPKSRREMSSPTIEIRYHQATLNADEILKWASVFQFLFDNVDKLSYDLTNSLYEFRNNPLEMCNVVASEIDMPDTMRDYLLARIKKYATSLQKVKWFIKNE